LAKIERTLKKNEKQTEENDRIQERLTERKKENLERAEKIKELKALIAEQEANVNCIAAELEWK
jgi:SMC interacting uncharacterized protein involved in chromosome segregation